MQWLNDNPVTEDDDVNFLIKTVDMNTTLAFQASVGRKNNEAALYDWKGKIPMLRLVEALVQNDDAKRAFLTRCNIDPGRHAMNGWHSIEKRAVTVWEILLDCCNDPDFNPTTEVVNDLHSEYLVEINLVHEQVASMHKATSEYIER
jgi:hypothetical protein